MPRAGDASAPAGRGSNASVASEQRSRRPLRLWVLMGLLVIVAWFGGRYALKRHWLSEADRALQSYRFGDAERVLTRAQRWFRDDGQIHLRQARLYRLQGDADRAMRHLNAAAETGVPRQRIGVSEQLITIQSGGAAEAHGLFPVLAQMTAHEGPLVLEAYAMGHALAGQYSQSQEMLRLWMQADPSDARPLFWMGTVLQQNGYAKEAREAFNRALQLDPQMARARAALAESYVRSGYLVRAAKHYRTAVAQIPEDRESKIASAILDLEFGDTERAVQTLESILARQPAHYDSAQALALHYQRQQRAEEIVRVVAPVIRRVPYDASLNYLLASAHAALGQEERSAKYYDVFLESHRRLTELKQKQQQLEDQEPTPQDALLLAEEFLKYDWKSAVRWVDQAAILAPADPRTEQLLEACEALSAGDPLSQPAF